MSKKYEFTGETKDCFGIPLKRIRALVTITGVISSGDAGGWIESEKNLSQDGDAWVSGDALVYGNARVSGDARVYGNASILWISKVGSEFGTLTAYRNKYNGITVTRGCFAGTLDEFREKVSNRHAGTNQEHGYLELANYIEWHFTQLHPMEGEA